VTERYRLTRRGRLLLQTLPLFLVTATGLSALADRIGDQPAARAGVATASPSPSASPTASPVQRAVRRRPPSVSPSATPRPTVRPTTPAPRLPYAGTGRLVTVPGTGRVLGTGPLRRFTVDVEAGLPDSPASFAAAVERVLADARGWGGGGRLSFQRVPSGPVTFRVVLAGPATTDRLCRPLRTGGYLSCYMNGRAVLNARRWHEGAPTYAGDLAAYRIYLVNHEIGHALGHGHAYACGPGGLARVMIQQTKSLRGCRRNPWPLPDER
jgi:hypothetical protein